ncbi:adhesin/hemagglutinin [Yersinia enterocolitica]|nr:adhesin/hemagglutinin [Yersinia enterocolitica]
MGSDLLSNLGGVVLSGLGNDGSAEGTTQAAVSDGSITIRDTDKQQQNVDDLSRDTDSANGSIGPIFDKEKEQNRLKEAQLIGEIGGQAMDIARTQGDILGLEAALKANPALKGDAKALRETAEYKAEMQKYGTSSALQQGLQAATAAIQGLAGGNMAQALVGASAPYLAEVIKKSTGDNQAANVMAHAVLGAVTAYASGNSALAGAAGAATAELMAPTIIAAMGWDKDNLSEDQKQTVSALATLAAGLAGGLTGDSTADTVAGAQTGKNAVENNSLHDIIDNKVSGVSQAEKYQNAQKQLVAAVEEFKAQNCAGISADACSAKMQANSDELLKGFAHFGVDFVPVIGDIKSVSEAQSALDYLMATIGFIPGAGDVAGKLIKAAEAALKKGDVAEASNLLNKASGEISAYNSANYPKLKDDLRQQNLDYIAKQDPRLDAVVKGDNGKLNYGVGNGTNDEADRLGKIWVGEGARPTSDGSGLVSADGTRIYRSPKEKPNAPGSLNPTGTQANFESYAKNIETGKMDKVGNGHLNISGENK